MKLLDIINDFKQRVVDNQPISPVQYLEAGARVNILLWDLDNEIVEYESKMADKEAELIEKGEPATKAKILRIRAIAYKDYLLSKALKERGMEFIRIAKKRSEINEM